MPVDNPLLGDWDGPLGLPPFAAVTPDHFGPAFDETMAAHLAELDAIAATGDAATFANTIIAFDRAGARFHRVSLLFGNLCSAAASPELQVVERTMAPRLAAHRSAISLHEGVFARIAALHAKRSDLGLDRVAIRLIERIHLDFVRGGATLTGDSRARAGTLSEELATLHTRFSQNVLADESAWHLALTTDDLVGLPDWLLASMAGAAQDAGLAEGSHALTISRSLITPFLMLSRRRDLRQLAWNAWMRRGENGGATDNRPLIGEILGRRLELARLHGYASFADYQLADTMAQRRDAVADLLAQVWVPARSAAIAEYEELGTAARVDGIAEVEPWDWRYYAQDVKRSRYELDDEEVKPYFSLDAVLGAAFDCAQRLFGLSFVERSDIATYHADVRTFEVRDPDGTLSGVFLSDNYARPTKRSGAWMSSYRLRADYFAGDAALPVVANHNNFAKAGGDGPTLLSLDDARTLFHEFGHGLHGLLSASPYQRLAGTNVLRDFVELPSQLFEHWLLEPEVLRRHARHVQTGAPIPDELIERIHRAAQFNQGFETVEYVSSALIDIALHERTEGPPDDLDQFERDQLAAIGMPPAMVLRHRLPHFSHLFSSSGYASAYYVYLWAEVLDADAYEAFIEAGSPFDPATADRLRTYIYSSGNTIEPGAAYRSFRGRDPGIEPLLRGRGLLELEV